MNCPDCGSTETLCIDSRAMGTRGASYIPVAFRQVLGDVGKWRRYRCLACDITWPTLEVPVPTRELRGAYTRGKPS